jgi:Holliday junction resolvase RusA-like endonuclease
MLELDLPFPPSVNHYWRHVGPRVLISRGGRDYRTKVGAILAAKRVRPLDGRLAIEVDIYPPDRRRRDLDNLQKALLDALAHGGAYHDDSQIDRLLLIRRDPIPGGKVHLHLETITHEQPINHRPSAALHLQSPRSDRCD